MIGFGSVRLKPKGGEEGRWRWRCKEGLHGINGDEGDRKV